MRCSRCLRRPTLMFVVIVQRDDTRGCKARSVRWRTSNEDSALWASAHFPHCMLNMRCAFSSLFCRCFRARIARCVESPCASETISRLIVDVGSTTLCNLCTVACFRPMRRAVHAVSRLNQSVKAVATHKHLVAARGFPRDVTRHFDSSDLAMELPGMA